MHYSYSELIMSSKYSYCKCVHCAILLPCSASGDEVLRMFWEVEDRPLSEINLSPEERYTVQHFKANQTRTKDGRLMVSLPKQENATLR